MGFYTEKDIEIERPTRERDEEREQKHFREGERDYFRAEVERLKTKGDADCRYLRGQYDSIVEMLHREQAEVERLRRLHEALLDTLTPSKSTWIQKVVKNARAALRGEGT